MQRQNWGDIKNILQELLESDIAERKKRLEVLPPPVREEIESLLVFEKEAEDWNPLTAAELAKDVLYEETNTANPLFGQRIGVYEIVGELGQGGMGVVYLAKRADGRFEQKVAVKMLRREFNVENIRRHFKRESEIQARLEHPFIARLLDVDTTEDGVPFFVMEYIEGVPVDIYCRDKNLSLTRRLKLFNKICQAVAHAHRNLTIHRDLKPSNILINREGEPKLLDFGISKLLDSNESEDKTFITLLGAMTPEYASPEQVRGENISTATDIYSLGVILYKMLTGNLPYNFSGKKNGDVLKTIIKDEPVAPSAIQDSNIQNSKLFKADLDNIILKALAKEPARRYETVERFSADLWRYIDGLPVLARPATFSYQARKFYGRNKVKVIAAVLILLSLLTGLTTALWQANAAHEQARIATDAQRQAESETLRVASEENKARAEKERAEKISRFVFKVLAYANPSWYAEGAKFNGETKVIEAMDELGDKIDVEFTNQPDVQSELHHRFAEVYHFHRTGARAGQAKEKEIFHARRAIELRIQFYGARHELVAKDMFYLYEAGGVEKTDEPKYLMEAIQMMRETNPHNLNLPYMLEDYAHRLIMPDTANLHDQYRQAVTPANGENKYRIAERFLLEALPIFREHYMEDNQAIYSNECRLAYAQLKQNKYTEANTHLEICRSAVINLHDVNQVSAVRKLLSVVEDAAAQTNPRNNR